MTVDTYMLYSERGSSLGMVISSVFRSYWASSDERSCIFFIC